MISIRKCPRPHLWRRQPSTAVAEKKLGRQAESGGSRDDGTTEE